MLYILSTLFLCQIVTTSANSNCAEVQFNTLQAQALGDKIELKYVLLENPDRSLCLQLESTDPSLDWIAMGFTRDADAPAMVSSPSTTALVYGKSFTTPKLFDLSSRSNAGVSSAGVDQNSISILRHDVTSNGTLRVVFHRLLVPENSVQEVTLVDNRAAGVIWAHGSVWPLAGGHAANTKGSVKLLDIRQSSSSGSTVVALYDPVWNLTSILTPVVLVLVLVICGSINRAYRPKILNQIHPAAPSQSKSSSSWIHTLTLDIVPQSKDLLAGELFMIVLVVMGFLVVILGSKIQYEDSTRIPLDSVSVLVTGNVATLALALVFVFRIPIIWETTVGIGHDRMIKYHRIIARVFFVFSTVHLILSLKLSTTIYPDFSITSSEAFGNQRVKPVYGFVAYVIFTSAALTAVEVIRRRVYSVFVEYHRFASTAGLVLVMLHCQTVQYMMIFPIVLLGCFLFQKGKQAVTNHFYCTITVDPKSACPTTSVLTLPVSRKTIHWAQSLHPGSYFLLRLPQVSLSEFHPFTAVVSPCGKTIGFAIKSSSTTVEETDSAKKKKATFSSKVLDFATSESRTELMEMRLIGPYGRLSLDLSDYTQLILIAGGIGITPLLSMLNQAQMEPKSTYFSSIEKIQLLWTVKTPQDLLACDTLMFPPEIQLPISGIEQDITYFVSQVQEDGVVTSSNGTNISYRAGRPNLSCGTDNVFGMSTDSMEKYSTTAICACKYTFFIHDIARSLIASIF